MANTLPSEPSAEEPDLYPLELRLCPRCGLLQLGHLVERRALFSDYPYLTGTSDSMKKHFAGYARDAVRKAGLEPGDLVIDVGSNDGTLLRAFSELGMKVLGVDPAANVASLASREGVETIQGFFSMDMAQEILASRGPARLVTANNVLAHVDDPRDMAEGLRMLTGDEGTVAVEVPSLWELIERLAYDTIYHEHISYFSADSLVTLFDAAGLEVLDIVSVPAHGGSMRVYASARSGAKKEPSVETALDAEAGRGLADPSTYVELSSRIAEHSRAMHDLLLEHREAGAVIAAYGAAAKGAMLLHHARACSELVEYVVDANPLKQGRYMPCGGVPVLPLPSLREQRPDLLLLLPWNIWEEIVSQESWLLGSGSRFLIPLPEIRFVQGR